MQSDSLEFSLLSIFSFLSFFTFFTIQKFSHKFFNGLLFDNDFDKPQAFHNTNIPRSGGLACLISFFIFILLNNLLFSTLYIDYLIIGTGLFFIGFLDDIKIRLKESTVQPHWFGSYLGNFCWVVFGFIAVAEGWEYAGF